MPRHSSSSSQDPLLNRIETEVSQSETVVVSMKDIAETPERHGAGVPAATAACHGAARTVVVMPSAVDEVDSAVIAVVFV